MTVLVGKLSAWTAALVLAAGGVNTGRVIALREKAEQLGREALAEVKVDGCATAEECKVVGLGHKACGGPREYIAYCPKKTNEKALQKKLDAFAKAEAEWQQAAGIKSNCGLTRQPPATLENGLCRTQ